MRIQPYKFWTLAQLNYHLVNQAVHFDYTYEQIEEISKAVFDTNWNPLVDFDGCTVVTDVLQPFLPCFIHDYNCIVKGWSNKNDLKFRKDCIKCGIPKWKASMFYLGVRVGYYFYYKWI